MYGVKVTIYTEKRRCICGKALSHRQGEPELKEGRVRCSSHVSDAEISLRNLLVRFERMRLGETKEA